MAGICLWIDKPHERQQNLSRRRAPQGKRSAISAPQFENVRFDMERLP